MEIVTRAQKAVYTLTPADSNVNLQEQLETKYLIFSTFVY